MYTLAATVLYNQPAQRSRLRCKPELTLHGSPSAADEHAASVAANALTACRLPRITLSRTNKRCITAARFSLVSRASSLTPLVESELRTNTRVSAVR